MKTLILIGGPTAGGKTALALQLARHLHTEILSADSRQCYRELTIGVAKPTPQELQCVPHHFINSHSIHEECSAGQYEHFALKTLQALFQQHDTVVCVGGTGLYINALCEGIDEMPAVDKAIQQNLEKEFAEKGLPWLQQTLQQADPLAYAQVDTQNPMRLLRALSFVQSSGRSITEFRQKKVKQRDFRILPFVLAPDRDLLYERINRRVDDMMREGLLEEVRGLLPFEHLKSLQTVGYTELFTYLKGACTLERAVELIKQHTRHYAKRQLTWFRHQTTFQWLTPQTAFDQILAALRPPAQQETDSPNHS